MQLYLIRHAESENNAKPLHRRVEDPSLTAVGRLQAKHLGDWVKTAKIDTLICSPVRRALQTTRFIADAKEQHVHVWADCFEEGGIYPGYGPDAMEGGTGLSRAQVIAHVGDETNTTLDETITDSGWYGRDRETPDEAIARATTVIQRFLTTFGTTDRSVAAVIHADFKRKLLDQMLNGSVDASRLGSLRNAGITKVNYIGGRWELDWFNSVSHLPAKLITGIET